MAEAATDGIEDAGNEGTAAPRRKGVPSAEKLAGMVIEQLKEGTAPWMNPVKPGTVGERPLNPKTGAHYRGVNQLLLSMVQPDADPRWCTIHQANDLGAKVMKGSRGVPIRALVGWETEEGGKLDRKEPPPPGARPLFRVYSMFHASQLEGIEPYEQQRAGELEWEPVEKAEELLRRSGATILHDQSNRCFYRRSDDTIHLPPKENFRNAEGYYSTALHELGHWTGHESRLGREMGGGFGSERYAREELRAELASYMLALELGIGHDPASHASYIDSWIGVLEKDPLEIYRASEDASRIVDHVMGRELERVRERDTVPEKEERTMGGKEAERLEFKRVGSGMDVFVDGDRAARVRWDAGQGVWHVKEASGLLKSTGGWVLNETEHVERAMRNEFEIQLRQQVRRVDLDVPYAERGEAKALGAKWDRERKTWYAELKGGAPLGDLDRWERSQSVEDPPLGRSMRDNLRELSGGRPSRQIDGAQALDEASRMPPAAGHETNKGRLFGGYSMGFDNRLRQQVRRVDLDVPYEERNEAKQAGAKWDRSKKTWYAVLEEGAPLGELKRWERDRPAPARPSPIEEFRAVCEAAGLVLDGDPVMDGEIHRVPVEGAKPGKRDGAYLAHLDDRPAGYVQNWRSGDEARWRYSGEGHALQRHGEDRRKVRYLGEERRAKREALQLETAKRVRAYLAELPNASIEHPYLASHGATVEQDHYDRTGGNPYGAKVDAKGNLVIPLRDSSGTVWSLQRIGEGGFKQCEKGGAVSGMYHVIGRESDLSKGPVLLTAGFGTGAAVAAATNRPVVCAINDGNLPKVAESLSQTVPQPILILADDDRHAEVKRDGAMVKHNSGARSAEKALEAVGAGGRIVSPNWTAEERASPDFTDFADVAKARGLAPVRRQVECEVGKAAERWREQGRSHELGERGLGLAFEEDAGQVLVKANGRRVGTIRKEGEDWTFLRTEAGAKKGMPDQAGHAEGLEALRDMLEKQYRLAEKHRGGKPLATHLGHEESGHGRGGR